METKKRLKEALEKHFGDDEAFDLHFDPSAPDQLTGVVTANAFEDKREYERQNILWDVLDEELTEDERADISLLIANTPEETDALDPQRDQTTG